MTRPNWTDRPANEPFVGQRVGYVIPANPRAYTNYQCYYGQIVAVDEESVMVKLDKNCYPMPYRFSKREDGMWSRFTDSKSHLRFKEDA